MNRPKIVTCLCGTKEKIFIKALLAAPPRAHLIQRGPTGF